MKSRGPPSAFAVGKSRGAGHAVVLDGGASLGYHGLRVAALASAIASGPFSPPLLAGHCLCNKINFTFIRNIVPWVCKN